MSHGARSVDYSGKTAFQGGKRKMIIDRALWALSPYEMRNVGIVENAL